MNKNTGNFGESLYAVGNDSKSEGEFRRVWKESSERRDPEYRPHSILSNLTINNTKQGRPSLKES